MCHDIERRKHLSGHEREVGNEREHTQVPRFTHLHHESCAHCIHWMNDHITQKAFFFEGREGERESVSEQADLLSMLTV